MGELARKIFHREFTIEVTDDYKFVVSGNGWPEMSDRPMLGRDGFDSLQSAKSKIDEHLLLQAKANKAAATVRIPVLLDDGTPTVIKGFHLVQGTALQLTGGECKGTLYPVVKWIETLLVERKKLQQRIVEINNRIGEYGVRSQVAYGRTHVERYDEKLAEFVKNLNDAATEAKRVNETPVDAIKPPLTVASGG